MKGPRSARRRVGLVAVALAALVAALLPALASTGTASAASLSLMVSTHADRSSARVLDGSTDSGQLAVFTTPDAGVSTVSFYLDDPNRAHPPLHVESWAPFTFAGDANGLSVLWNSAGVADGAHTITAAVVASGTTQVVTAHFTVANNPSSTAAYALQVSPHADRSAGAPLAGATVSGTEYVSVPSVAGISRVAFWLDDPARAHPAAQVEGSAPWDFRGTGVSGANPWQTTGVADGSHVVSADVTTASGVVHVDATFTVANGAPATTPPPTTAPPTTVPPTTAPPTTVPPTTVPPTTVPPTTVPPTTVPPTTVPPTTSTTPSTAVPSYTFSAIAPMPTGTTEAESVVVNDQLYVFGGFDVHVVCCTSTNRAWRYDPKANTWTALAPMPANGISHAGMAYDGSRYIYYAGGYGDDPQGIDGVNATDLGFRYDLQTNTYTALPDLPSPRAAGGMGYANGKLYYFGGSGPDRNVDWANTWMLDIAGGATQWVDVAPMPNPRDHLGFTALNGQFYVIGGEHKTDPSTAQPEIDRYDPVTDTWTALAPMPVPRSHLMDSSFVVNGKIYTAGGWTTNVISPTTYVYDPATNSWTTTSKVPESRTSATARSLSDGRWIWVDGSAGLSNATGWIATPTG